MKCWGVGGGGPVMAKHPFRFTSVHATKTAVSSGGVVQLAYVPDCV